MESVDAQIERLMGRILTMTMEGSHAGIEVILEFMGLRPPYCLYLVAGDAPGSDDPRWKVFEAQLTYILNTGGLMFILTPLPFKSVHPGTGGRCITRGSCGVCAVRFLYGRWFPVPADQIDPLFEPPAGDGEGVHWLFRDFPSS